MLNREKVPNPEANANAPQGQAPQGRPAPRPVPPIGGDAYFQKVWADLHDDDYFTRKSAVERLADLKPNDQRAKVAPRLIELMDDPSPFIRKPAVRALGAWGSKDDVPALMRALAHQDVFTRQEVLKVIGRFKDARTLPPVLVNFREFSTRKEAAIALRQMGAMAETDVLAIVNERDQLQLLSLKQSAIEVLADIGTEKSVPTLEKVAASENIHHRGLVEAARKALAAIGERRKK
jgi:HEAT repeat protein